MHIGLLQETWLQHHDKLTDPNYTIHRLDRVDGYGGIATIVHKTFTSKIIKEINNSDIQLLELEITYYNFHIYVVNVYCKPSGKNFLPNFWHENVFNHANGFSLVAGDFNGHHPFWYSIKANNRGRALYKAYSESNYIIINDESPTTIPTLYHQPAIIDLSFTTPELHNLITKWEVGKDSLGSDHIPITMQFNF